jgi:homoserine kinase
MSPAESDPANDANDSNAPKQPVAEWAVRVPASSANIGAGFDVLGMALTLHAWVGCGAPPSGSAAVDEHHPATIAFRRLGGEGPLWVRSAIPMARGLGFSGAVRIGGAAAALVQQRGPDALEDEAGNARVLDVASDLEQHADNAAASLRGGIVVAAGSSVHRVPLAFDPAVVVWVPEAATTSTDHSRTTLSATVSRQDAVFNLGRVAAFVAACAVGDVAALRTATEDRLHQAVRLEQVPGSAAAMQAGLDAGAWASWLSGSGPTVAMFCEWSRADEVAAALPPDGHVKLLRIDHEGAIVTDVAAVGEAIGATEEPAEPADHPDVADATGR